MNPQPANSMRHGPALLTAALILLTVACDSTEPPRPAEATASSPDVQSTTAGSAVDSPPAVRVISARGNPVPGVNVSWTVSAGEGSVENAVQRTNEQGVATLTSWTLGTTAGENVVTASVEGLAGVEVVFRATGVPGPPGRLSVVTQPPAIAASGTPLIPQPVVRLQDQHGNNTPVSGVTVTAAAEGAAVQLEGATAITDAQGVATFRTLALNGGGTFTLSFAVPGLATVAADASTVLIVLGPGACADPVPLAFRLGEMRRVTLSDPRGLTCVLFDMTRNLGEQYLLLFENMPMHGGATTSLFSTAFGPPSPSTFNYTLRSTPQLPAATAAQPVTQHMQLPVMPHGAGHSWDFGAGPIYEIHPDEPPGGVSPPMLLRAHGQTVDINAAGANPQIGDTITLRMEGISRLSIPTGNQRAVIRYISEELVFAEDVRLTTVLARENGAFNTPLSIDTMAAIAREYAAHAKRQGDLLFDGRYNNSIHASGNRVVAVHSVMYANNIWGYTYSSGNYFVWDYWVGTNGSTGGANQYVQRNADNLFMHEIAHMRELGILQQDPTAFRGFRWLTEGFARFSERLPIAARLLGSESPSRTDNVRLPLNPIFGGTSYFRDDVPTFLSMTMPMFDGYQNSSYVFDYFADQVALSGRDWRAAIREFLLASGRPAALDAVVSGYLGITFPELFTRARIALFLDDIGTPGLPAWTQYHQYRLRESRPAGSAGDPRNILPRLVPGDAVSFDHGLSTGSAWGYVIDGTQARVTTVYGLSAPFTSNAVMSITRIR